MMCAMVLCCFCGKCCCCCCCCCTLYAWCCGGEPHQKKQEIIIAVLCVYVQKQANLYMLFEVGRGRVKLAVLGHNGPSVVCGWFMFCVLPVWPVCVLCIAECIVCAWLCAVVSTE